MGNLEVLRKQLSEFSVYSDFDTDWKEEVDSKLSRCSSVSCEDDLLEKAVDH